MMKRIAWLLIVVLLAGGLLVPSDPAAAHQPFCEDADLTPETAWRIQDANVSTAFYGTLESGVDVDFFALEAAAGQRVFLSITIPQIEGQAAFDPVIGVFGAGLPEESLMAHAFSPADGGALLLPAMEATEFYEPFGGRYYWQRQEASVTLPEGGEYLIAVWHPEGEIGRYTFVYGQREVLGGDYGCNDGEYWTPVEAPAGTEPAREPSLLEQVLALLGGRGGAEHPHTDDHSHSEGDNHAHQEEDGHAEAHDHGG